VCRDFWLAAYDTLGAAWLRYDLGYFDDETS
jgi:hypothetical protein